jgi:DNA adenine methylase
VERARRFAVKTAMSYGGSAKYRNGFRTGISPASPNPAGIWGRYPDTIRLAAARLKGAQIENKPAEELIAAYNNPDTLIYCDPPYLLGTRKKHLYKNEMTDQEHESLLYALKGSRSKVVVSGYDSALYNGVLKGWDKFTLKTICEQGKPRTECLWLNYDVGLLGLMNGQKEVKKWNY